MTALVIVNKFALFGNGMWADDRGGWNDFIAFFDDADAAKLEGRKIVAKPPAWFQVVDLSDGTIVEQYFRYPGDSAPEEN